MNSYFDLDTLAAYIAQERLSEANRERQVRLAHSARAGGQRGLWARFRAWRPTLIARRRARLLQALSNSLAVQKQ